MAISLIKIFLLLLITPLDFSFAEICITATMEVHIINKLPSGLLPLQIHCESRDDDLGNHSTIVNEDYHWRFCAAITNKSLFFCRFRWGMKYKVFDVFNDGYYCIKGLTLPNFLNYCKWEVRSEGFYLEQYNAANRSYFMTYLQEWH